jgi:hypothetical protein
MCTLEIEKLGPFPSWKDALNALPASGSGWVMHPDRVTTFSSKVDGIFLAAEVVDGLTSVHLRHDGEVWRGWRYTEKPGTTHRRLPHHQLKAVVKNGRSQAPQVNYAEYWTLATDVVDESVKVWTPVAARFIGFSSSQNEGA